MRQQIAAANWKMNLTAGKASALLTGILSDVKEVQVAGRVVFAVPFPYLTNAVATVQCREGFSIGAQNCSNKPSGAYTGEVSVEMLDSIGVQYCVVGHSERREYFAESNQMLAEKVDLCLAQNLTPIFCCGEPLEIREKENQNNYVRAQIEDSLNHLSETELKRIVIAYEPIWAIGTGRTATTEQAQQMHAFIRSVLTTNWGASAANAVSILYGGSVKAANANELFACPDVDGGLVGGASLVAAEFVQIINALKH